MSIEDYDGNFYVFPVTFFMSSDPFSVRSSMRDLIYNHGSRQIADGFINVRQIAIVGELSEATAEIFETEYRALIKAVMKGGKLRIPTDSIPRYLEVSAPSIDSEWLTFPNYKRLDITFNVEMPFWQDDDETTYIKVTTGNDTLIVDLSGSDHIVMPIIEIDADQAADMPSVKLRNTSDGGMTFEYNNPLFTSGAILAIDSSAGTILLNSNDAISSLISGAFLRLQPKSNTIYFEGAACTIKVKYRKVYL